MGLSSSPLQRAASIHSSGMCFSDENQRSPEDTITCKGQCSSNIAAHIRAIKGVDGRTGREGRDAMCRWEKQPPLL